MPSRSSCDFVASRSGVRPASDAYTVFPVRASSVATDRPLRASPMTAISPRIQSARNASADTRGVVTLPQLERAHREHAKQNLDDPETHDDLRLVPPLHLEVVVQRRAQQQPVFLRVLQAIPLAAVLEDVALAEHRQRLRHEDEADEEEQEFGFEQDRDRSD